MESGNFAEAQLRALIDVAAVAAGAHRLEEVLELVAEHALVLHQQQEMSMAAHTGTVPSGCRGLDPV